MTEEKMTQDKTPELKDTRDCLNAILKQIEQHRDLRNELKYILAVTDEMLAAYDAVGILNTRAAQSAPEQESVTVEELNEEICSKMHELIFQDGINADIYSILKKYEGRIIRAEQGEKTQ